MRSWIRTRRTRTPLSIDLRVTGIPAAISLKLRAYSDDKRNLGVSCQFLYSLYIFFGGYYVKPTYGLEQARAQLPHIAAEARAGHPSLITRHGVPVAAVVPVSFLQSHRSERVRKGGILALRGTGRELWQTGAGKVVAELRDEWQTE